MLQDYRTTLLAWLPLQLDKQLSCIQARVCENAAPIVACPFGMSGGTVCFTIQQLLASTGLTPSRSWASPLSWQKA